MITDLIYKAESLFCVMFVVNGRLNPWTDRAETWYVGTTRPGARFRQGPVGLQGHFQGRKAIFMVILPV